MSEFMAEMFGWDEKETINEAKMGKYEIVKFKGGDFAIEGELKDATGKTIKFYAALGGNVNKTTLSYDGKELTPQQAREFEIGVISSLEMGSTDKKAILTGLKKVNKYLK